MSQAEDTDSPRAHGVNSQVVIEAILRREERMRKGMSRDDGRRIGLVVEGGALRGVHSGGGMVALSRLGLQGVFDCIFATSAGVMNSAYFLSGQADLGISVYYDDLASKTFINPLRWWKILNLDYLFDHVVVKSKPLDLDALKRSPTQFHVTMLDQGAGHPLVVDAVNGTTPTLTCLKAATAIPILYNRCVTVDGKRCFDGGMVNPIPILHAVRDQCTDVLVLLTRPFSYVRPPPSLAGKLLFDFAFARGNSRLSRLVRQYHAVDRNLRDIALGRTQSPPGVNIAAICAPENTPSNSSSATGESLWRSACHYGERTLNIFGRADMQIGIAPPMK